MSVVASSEELEKKAMFGEKAARLLENEDFVDAVRAYDAFLAEQEEQLAPRDTEKFTVLRAIRRGVAQFREAFLEGVKAEGEAARMEQQGISPDKRIIM